MKLMLITTAIGALLASGSLAGALDVPYTMKAVHADFEAQLAAVAAEPGDLGLAARSAARLFEAQNARQAELVLPLIGTGDLVAHPRPPADTRLPERAQTFTGALPALLAGEESVVSALSELYAAADLAEKPEVALLAERIIWHQTNDVEVLYPQAVLVSTMDGEAPVVCVTRSAAPGEGALYGPNPTAMMGVGDPHAVK